MREKNYHNQTIALAGVVQAAVLVAQISWRGAAELKDLTSSINSLFKLSPASALDVFEHLGNIQTGLTHITEIFNNSNKIKTAKYQEIARYTLSLIYLERKLMKEKGLLDIVSKGISRAKMQAEHFSSVTHDNVLANLAGIYADTISTFNFRINITGNQLYLTNPVHVNKVRALLLAGIRAVVLWRQMGGSRWQLIFGRKQYLTTAKKLLSQIEVLETV